MVTSIEMPGYDYMNVGVKGNLKSGEEFISFYDEHGLQIRRFTGNIDVNFPVKKGSGWFDTLDEKDHSATNTIRAVLTTNSKGSSEQVRIRVYGFPDSNLSADSILDPESSESSGPSSRKTSNSQIWWSGDYSSNEMREIPLMAFARAKWLRARITGQINNDDELTLFDQSVNKQASLKGELNHCLFMSLSGVKAVLDSSEKTPLHGLTMSVSPYQYEACDISWPSDGCRDMDWRKAVTISVVGAKGLEIRPLKKDSDDQGNVYYDSLKQQLSSSSYGGTESISVPGYNVIVATAEQKFGEHVSPFSLGVKGWVFTPEYSKDSGIPLLSMPDQERVQVNIAGKTKLNENFITVFDEAGNQVKRVSGVSYVSPFQVKGDCVRLSLKPDPDNALNIKLTRPDAATDAPEDVYQIASDGRRVRWQVRDISENEQRISPPLSVNLADDEIMAFTVNSKNGWHFVDVRDAAGEILYSNRGKFNEVIYDRDMNITIEVRAPGGHNGIVLDVLAEPYKAYSTDIEVDSTTPADHEENTEVQAQFSKLAKLEK